MRAIDRGWFLQGCDAARQYEDSPQPISLRATISAPHMHAMMLELVADAPCGLSGGGKILDIGSGSGYLTAAMAHMAGPSTQVIGIEHLPDLMQLSGHSLGSQAYTKGWLQPGGGGAPRGEEVDDQPAPSGARLRFIQGDGRVGLPEEAPFNVIHVGAALLDNVQPLVDQLTPGGRLVVPVEHGEGDQHLWVYERSMDGKTVKKLHQGGVRFVPLTDLAHYQK